MTALYSSGPMGSSFSQPGMAVEMMAGSRNADHTRSRGAGMSLEPSIFIWSPRRIRWRGAHGGPVSSEAPATPAREPRSYDARFAPTSAQSHAGDVDVAHRRVDQERPVGEVDGADGAHAERVTSGIVEPDERALELIPAIERRAIGAVAHEAERETGEREAPRGGTLEVRVQGGLPMPPARFGGSPARVLRDRQAEDFRAAPPRVRAQHGLALPGVLKADHEVGIQKRDLAPLEDPPQLPADQPARVHDDPLEPRRGLGATSSPRRRAPRRRRPRGMPGPGSRARARWWSAGRSPIGRDRRPRHRRGSPGRGDRWRAMSRARSCRCRRRPRR